MGMYSIKRISKPCSRAKRAHGTATSCSVMPRMLTALILMGSIAGFFGRLDAGEDLVEAVAAR